MEEPYPLLGLFSQAQISDSVQNLREVQCLPERLVPGFGYCGGSHELRISYLRYKDAGVPRVRVLSPARARSVSSDPRQVL